MTKDDACPASSGNEARASDGAFSSFIPWPPFQRSACETTCCPELFIKLQICDLCMITLNLGKNSWNLIQLGTGKNRNWVCGVRP